MQHPMAPRVGAPRQHVVVRDQPRHGDEEGGVEVGDLVLLISLLLCEVRLFFSRMPPRNRSINTIISTKPTSRKSGKRLVWAPPFPTPPRPHLPSDQGLEFESACAPRPPKQHHGNQRTQSALITHNIPTAVAFAWVHASATQPEPLEKNTASPKGLLRFEMRNRVQRVPAHAQVGSCAAPATRGFSYLLALIRIWLKPLL